MKSTITMADANEYYRQADLEAIRFIAALRSEHQNYAAQKNHRIKYAMVFERQVSGNLPTMLTVIGHAAAGVIEGLIFGPLFLEMINGMITNPLILKITSYLPVAIFFGFTLTIGDLFHKANIRRDTFDQQRIKANWTALIMALFLSVGYVFFLYSITEMAKPKLKAYSMLADLLFWIGLFEVVLSYFAIIGWNNLFAYFLMFRNEYKGRSYRNQMQMYAHKCEQQYHFYEQANLYCNLQNGMSNPPKMNNRIKVALEYSNGNTDYNSRQQEDLEIKRLLSD